MKIFDKLANLMAAVAFAEEGDVEEARRLVAEEEDDGTCEPASRITPASRPAPRADVPLPRRSRA